MGFTETMHPELSSKIKAQVPSVGSISKEKEDDIVTNLLEELILKSPPHAPIASGSGLHHHDDDRSSIPGAWE
jgi:hypothetical protein